MSFEKRIARIFNLHGDNWIKHANPWSIWTRFVTLPFIVLAIWSRVWIGWYCILPIILLIIWIIINPTLFAKPKNLNNWGSKSVLGERYWSERDDRAVPEYHHAPILILTLLQTMGGLILIYGLYALCLNWTVLGMTVVYFAKMWFLDRMVWVFEDMTRE